MTVSSTTVKNSYSGNGSTTQFAYGFKIFADSDLIVIIRSSTGTETVKTLTTHYTVAGAGDASGGSITFTSGNTPASGETVVIIREVPQTQAIDYIANDPFPAESHEEGLDRATMTTQQVQEEVDRSLKLSRTNTMTSTEFTVGATDRANKVLSFDSSGELAVTQELGTFRGNWSASTAYQVRDLVKDTSTNNIFMANTAHTSSGSQPLTSNTDSAKWDLIVDAATATTSSTSAANSATAAANSATASANSATASANSASAASTSETNAASSASTSSTQATNSANSATASANSASAAAATFDLFDDSYLGAKSSNPTVDNDGNALQDGALYFDTTNDVMKVYNLSTTTWLQLTPTVSNQNNINSAVANASNINAAVANASNINAAVANASNINSAVSNASNINTVAGIASNVTSVANNETNINSVNSNSSNINTVAGSITNVNNVGGSIANVNTVATNLASVNNFGEVYRIASSAPTTSLNSGDLYFDTTTNILNVYGASGWQNAGSSVNGTSDRFKFVASGTPTTFSGSDANGNTLSYDAGFIDVYLNGIKMVNGTDVTVTSGSSIVFASALTNGDIVEAVAFGTFAVASLTNTTVTGSLSFPDNIKAKFGTGNDLEIFHDGSNSNISDVGTGGLILRTDGTQIALNKGSSENMAKFITDGAVELYHNNIKKFETTSTGATVTGKFNVSSNIADFAIKSENTTHNARVDIIASGSNKNSILNFGDGASSTVGFIDYDHADNSLRFATSATERGRFDSSGNLLLGATSVQGGTANTLQIADGSSARLLLQNTGGGRTYGFFAGTDGKLGLYDYSASAQRLAVDTSGKFGIGTASPTRNLEISDTTSGATTGIRLVGANNGSQVIEFADTDDVNVGYITYDHTNNRMVFRAGDNQQVYVDGSGSLLLGTTSNGSAGNGDLVVNGGIFLGGTGTANKLEDYEEGTWTPAVSSGITSPTYSTQRGSYVKIGKMVYYTFDLRTSGGTLAAQDFIINGLPFSQSTDVNEVAGSSYIRYGFDIVSGSGTPFPIGAITGTQIDWHNTAGVKIAGTALQNSTIIIISNGFYQIA
jgi:hypothetical protein